MEGRKSQSNIGGIFLGKRYYQLANLNEQARYATMRIIFIAGMLALIIMGINAMAESITRAVSNFGMTAVLFSSFMLMRTKIPVKILGIAPTALFGAYCIILLNSGELYLWIAVWLFVFPLLTIFLCGLVIGGIEASAVIITASILLYTPSIPVSATDPQIKFRFIGGYVFILILTVISEYISTIKDRKEVKLRAELANKMDEIDKSKEEINTHLQKATESGFRLNNIIVESSQALNVISKNTEKTLNETNVQLKSVEQTSNHVKQIVKSIDNLEAAVISQGSHISSSSSSIEEMVANIDSIRSVTAEITKTADTLSQSSASGNEMLKKLAEEVDRLHERSAMLLEANKIIQDIASKTNLLAMNAAIEAAHAGETGKGFAVVSDEIRKLAEMASKESKGIKEEIKKMDESIKSISGVTGETVKSMNSIFNGIKKMDSAFAQVNNAVEEQAQGGTQILTALSSIKVETEKVRTGSETIQIQSGSISEEIQKLQQISELVTKQVTEINAANRQISSVLENANQSCHR